MKTIEQQLSREIESAVERIVAASRAAALAAVERAFAQPASSSKNVAIKRGRETKQRSAPKRSREEIVALGEEFIGVVVETPGETMTVLAPKIGRTPRELQRPVQYLRAQGRLKTIGERHHTQYFPVENTQ